MLALVFRSLQLLPSAWLVSGDACDGRRYYGSCLGVKGTADIAAVYLAFSNLLDNWSRYINIIASI